MTATTTAVVAPDRSTFGADIAHTLRLIVVAGVTCGALVVGVGSRLAMLLLRVTTGPEVHGVESDDGFRIGQVTLSGTYSLLSLGAGVGVIGASAYLLVRTWLIGPQWLRRATTGVASAAVAGAMLVHDDGIDFHLLTPTWLAIGLFVALPGLFGVAIAVTVDRFEAHLDVRTASFWWPPLVLLALFPFVLAIMPFVAAGVLAVTSASSTDGWRRVRSHRGVRVGVRAVWASVAVLGLLALVSDVVAIV